MGDRRRTISMKPQRVLSILFVAALFSVNAMAQGARAPKLVAEQREFTAGAVKSGEEVSHSFVIKNDGNAELQIRSVVPSCGCTASEFTRKIAPGQAGKVTLLVRTSGYSGPITKDATVTTNDPQMPKLVLTMSMIVNDADKLGGKRQGPFIVGPSDQISRRIPHGSTATAVMSITSDGPRPFKINRVEPNGKAFTVDLQPLPNNKGYMLKVASSAALPVGVHSQTVELETDDPQYPKIQVKLEADIVPPVDVTPVLLTFDNLPQPGAATDATRVSKFVWVRQADGGLALRNATSTLPFVKLSIESSDQEGRQALVRVGFSAQPPSGVHEGTLRIETNNKEVPFLEVKVRVIAP
jgi:hypothetical protein